ncbi:MAG: hypothetical protein V7K98_09405 [Nostoc sp.]
MGNGEWGMEVRGTRRTIHAQCPMPNAQCPIPKDCRQLAQKPSILERSL